MSEAYRRVIVKPDGLGEDQLAQLVSSLAAAVELQNQLADQSPHVLRFVGDIQQTEHTLFVEHEPAEPFPVAEFFDPNSPLAEKQVLLRTAAAILDALRVVHGASGPRPLVHGGLCPGVLLTTADGMVKVADVGFAPAVCTALGAESYLNLAVGPRTQGPHDSVGTGVWEILPRQTFDRSDRICSFIDPEKYASRMYQGFEPKSDIIAAGFILHLLAEHRHPYFHDDPEAHRMVEIAEYMAMGTATRARRKELRESSDPAVRLWCDLVARMIDRLPQNRPAAATLAEDFKAHEGPVTLDKLPERKVEVVVEETPEEAAERERLAREWLAALQVAVAGQQWDVVDRRLADRLRIPKSLEDLQAQIADIENQVRYRRQLGEQLRRSAESLAAGNIAEARRLAGQVERETDQPDLVEEARRLRERIAEAERRLAEEQARIERARARVDDLLADAEQEFKNDTQDSLREADGRVAEALATPEISPPQRQRGEQLLASIEKRLGELLAEAQRREATLAKAQGDLRESRELLAAGRFKKAEDKARPHVDSEFDDIQQEAKGIIADIANALGRYRSGLRRQLETAEQHLRKGRIREAIEAARTVDKDEYADDAIRTEARYTMNAAQEALGEIDRARLKAIADRDQALAALREGDLEGARTCAQDVLDNEQADADARADADRVLAVLPEFDAGKTLMADEDFPGAMEAFESILRPREGALWPPARVAAERLRDLAGQSRKNKLVDSIERHLAHRAQREEAAAEVGVVPPDESLSGSAPAWVLTTLTQFETFLQDCSVISKPAQPGESEIRRGGTLSPGDRLGEKYEVLEFLGRGGMGEVFRARDLSLDREVALKLAAPAAESGPLAEALRNEAKAIAALTHPHIIHINSFDVIDDRPYFDTNYIRGHDLDQYARQHSLSWREMADILIPIAEALAYAHKRGVLHGDVKPQNIYLGERPGDGPWLIDFGLARIRSLCGRRASMGLCGTPGFIAPEVITSMGEDVDQRADIFALGCVLYGLLTREAPFRRGDSAQAASSSSPSRMLLNTLRSQMVPLVNAAPKSPESLRRVCERAMAPQPQDRYQDAGELARDLRRFLLQLDQQDAESKLAQARKQFDARPRKEPAEIGALDEAAALAEHAGRLMEEARRRCEQIAGLVDEAQGRAIEELRGRAAQLVEEAQRQRRQIIESQENARLQLQAAGDRATAGRFRAALAASRNVLANPYVPDLHEEARKIADEARQHVRAATRKMLKRAGAAACALALVLGVCWYAFLRPFPPKILRAPKDAVVNLGDTVSFTVEAKGRPRPAYQWQRKVDGVWRNLPGQSAASLKITPVRTEDVGEYQCLVSNGQGGNLQVPAALKLEEQIVIVQYAITWTNQGEGTVYVSPPAERHVKGAQIKLTAAAAIGWRFDHWEGDLKGSEEQASLVMDADKNVTAVFVQTAVVCALSVGKQGEGFVEATPAGERHEKGTQVTLTARPFANWRFDHWEGDLTGTQERASLAMDKDKTVTAVFVEVPPAYALLTSKQGEGQIEAAPPGEEHAKGTEVILTAKAAKGWRFDRWLGDLTGTEAQAKVTMDKAKSVTAVFIRDLPMHALSLTSQGDGKVEVLPPGERYVQGTEVTVTAMAEIGWRFDHWETEAAVQGNPARFKMDADKTLKAVFVRSGWPQLSDAVVQEVKGLLVGGQASPLKGYAPEWVSLTSEGGKLSLVLSYPGYGQMLARPAIPIPFPTNAWPNEASQQPAKAAETIATAFQQVASADPGLNNLMKYLAFWGQRQALENDLLKELPEGTDGPVSLEAGKLSGASGYLTRLARIKWMSADVPETPAIGDWTKRLQDTLEKNRGVDQIPIQIRPTRFIEYFWGPQWVHAIYWFANQPGSAAVWYARLGPVAELGPQVRDLVLKKTAAPKLGERLLGRIIRDGSTPGANLKFFEVTNPNKSFGIALAPDGPLCFISLTRLPFDPIAVDMSVPDAAQISDQLNPLTGNITQLGALYTGAFGTAHTAAWVLVSLATGPPADKALTPTELWEIPAEIITASGAPGEALAQQRLAAAQSIREFGRAFNADLVCFRSDQVAAAEAVRQGIKAVDRRFNEGDGGEVFDAGYLCPRVGDPQLPWFILITSPVASGQ